MKKYYLELNIKKINEIVSNTPTGASTNPKNLDSNKNFNIIKSEIWNLKLKFGIWISNSEFEILYLKFSIWNSEIDMQNLKFGTWNSEIEILNLKIWDLKFEI